MQKLEALQKHKATRRTPSVLDVRVDRNLSSIRWGREDELLSAAYWKWRCEIGEAEGHDYVCRSGSLREEVGFCLLGGFGVKMEVNDAFFRHLKAHGVFEGNSVPEDDIRVLLEQRIDVEGRKQKYRFPRQKAKRIAVAMDMLDVDALSTVTDTEFRQSICTIPGIGPKTASWIARNWRGADTVAILDIHVLRAGWFLGIFDKGAQLPRDYYKLEEQFLAFADAIEVRASVLDAVIWSDMRIFGSRLVNFQMVD